VSTLVTDRKEHGQYYLSPATVAEVTQYAADAGSDTVVVVDGTPHPGQLVDLQTRLQSVAVVDKRRVVWERLAEANPVAATLVTLRTARLERRQAADAQRDASASDPSGTSGALADSNKRIQMLRDQLKQQQAAARDSIRSEHTAVDAAAVLLGGVGAATTPLWATLTGENHVSSAGLPARPRTAQIAVGPHTLALTDTPGVPSRDGLPRWFREAVPGVVTAMERATCILIVEGQQALFETVADQFDTPCRLLSGSDADSAREALAAFLTRTSCAIQLPYTDDAHALVSELHDDTVVQETEYDDAIYLRLEVSQTAVTELQRRVDAVDGDLKRLDTDSDSGGSAPR
jgi:50S ribosomal subunit-associated GTPase HflX